jgi:hypothetical protein
MRVNGSTSDGKIARLPLMTRSLILGLHGERLSGQPWGRRADKGGPARVRLQASAALWPRTSLTPYPKFPSALQA